MVKAWRVFTAFALLTAVACGGDDDGSGPTGSIQLSASPSALTLQQGGSGTVTVTLVRGGGFADPVNVAVTGLPSGVTLSVNPAQLTGATTQAVVTVNVASTVPAGTYTATVTATATGIGSATATYTLTVTAVATPNYSLTATPAAVSATPGGSVTSTIGITRTSFTGAVALTLDNPPAGITGSFNPASATADQSVLTINVGAAVAAGSYNLTVKGSATGPGDKTTTVALTVTAPTFTLSATPAALTLAAGASGTSSIAIVRTSFTTDVALTLVSPPAGITGVFTPATLTGATLTSSLALSVAASVAAGTYPITVQGVGGALTRTTVVNVTVPAPGSFTISATPAAVNIAAGASGTSSIAIVRTNFTTDVALTLVSPPAGITGVFTPATLTGATLTSSLALSVAGSVAAGTYPITVQGAGGSLTQTTVVNVTVTAAANFTISATPAALNIGAGASGTSSIAIVRTSFTTDVALTLVSPPAGITGVFTPATLTGATLTSSLALSVAGSVAAGTYPVTVQGAGGSLTKTTVVNVTVPQAGGNNFTWEFCNTPNNVPLKFWSLSGGTWTEVTGVVVGSVTRFAFTVSTGSTGIAYTASASGFSTTIVYFTQSTELGGFVGACTTPTTVQKTFNLSGQVGGEVGQLGYGGAAAVTGAASSYNLNVAPGTYDWLWAFGTSSGMPVPTTTYTNYRIGRGEATAAGAVSVNRAGAPAFVTAPFSFTGGGSGVWLTTQSLSGANGQVSALSIGSILTGTSSGNMLFLQPGDRLSTDNWLLSATHIEADQNGKGDTRTSGRYVGSAPGSLTFALPGKVPAFTVTSSSASIPWNAAGSIPTEYQGAASTVSASFTGAGLTATATLIATRAWLVANNMSTSYTLTGPTLPNFLAAWAPASPLSASSVIMVDTNLTGPPTAGGFLNVAIRIQ